MKTLLQISLLIITTIMFFSCQKFGTVKVEGQVYEYGTEKAVSGATVTFWEFQASGIGSGGGYYLIDSVKTDENGYYEYDQLDKEMYYVHIAVKKDNYFYFDYRNNSDGISFKPEQGDAVYDISLDPEAYLTIDIVDNPEIDAYGVNVRAYFTNTMEYYSNETKINGTVKGNRYNEIFIKQIMKTTEDEAKYDSIFLNAFEEKTYTIEF